VSVFSRFEPFSLFILNVSDSSYYVLKCISCRLHLTHLHYKILKDTEYDLILLELEREHRGLFVFRVVKALIFLTH